ncbi:cysteine peptidase family C39 domain-containing protein [Microtetraspora malaysiensis]|uniref:cysteine peptidase family C39 domain-containing protein n=1 Tax=Microtetraspora malaysiensis TaxID=161358 RepID=UPI000832CA95|nr:cysteine peptidase family C39 domain-containing protein [Microtetraspora malaysiensis]
MRLPVILQHNLVECGAACLAMVLGAHGHQSTVVALAAEEALAGVATCRMEANSRDDLVALFGVPATDARAGRVLGPARLSDGGFCVVSVLAVETAVLDEVTRGLVERRIFDEWLADRRRHAHVEWFWGSRPRTDALTAALRAWRCVPEGQG